MAKTVALVQARMGSTRFPGKMLAQLGSHSLLEWVLNRVRRARMIDTIVLSTTTLRRDDQLVLIAQQLGIEVFRGSESDVLGRLAAAASQFEADIVVRVCADNPFIDSVEIDRLVTYFKHVKCDYAFNHLDRLGSRYADGFGAEIMYNSLLQHIAQSATDSLHREHATLYIWDNDHDYCLSAVPAPHQLAYPQLRFDVDLPHDLAYLATLVKVGVAMNSSSNIIVQVALEINGATLVASDRLRGIQSDLNAKYIISA